MPSFLQQLIAQLAGQDTPNLPTGPSYGPVPGTMGQPGGEMYGYVPWDDMTQGGMVAQYFTGQNRGLGPMGAGPWDQGIGLGGYGMQFNPSAVLDPSQVQMNPFAGWFPDAPRGIMLPSGMAAPSPPPAYDPVDAWGSLNVGGYPWGPRWDQMTRSPYTPP